jgi:hypothetical protein
LGHASSFLDFANEIGRWVAFPTQTVYGLGGDAGNYLVVASIFATKGRSSFNPLIIPGVASHIVPAKVRPWVSNGDTCLSLSACGVSRDHPIVRYKLRLKSNLMSSGFASKATLGTGHSAGEPIGWIDVTPLPNE